MNSVEVKTRVINVNRVSCKYVVARLVDGQFWFWGQWDDEDEARKVAEQFENGVVLERGEN